MKPIGCLVAGAALALVPFAAHAQADASGYPTKPNSMGSDPQERATVSGS